MWQPQRHIHENQVPKQPHQHTYNAFNKLVHSI